ncbi:MAG: hypothetical protein KGL39_24635 [Patescibacteria group bacterium]|nr:hypothetical protein [Patescibacteria group bacterium]
MADQLHISAEAEAHVSKCWGCRDITRRMKINPDILKYQPKCPVCGTVFFSVTSPNSEQLAGMPAASPAIN